MSPAVRLLIFEVPDHSRWNFFPDNRFEFEVLATENNARLAYSIASSPGMGSRFELWIKAGRLGSLPERLYELRNGEEIGVCPPQGGFVLRQLNEDTVSLAAGHHKPAPTLAFEVSAPASPRRITRR